MYAVTTQLLGATSQLLGSALFGAGAFLLLREAWRNDERAENLSDYQIGRLIGAIILSFIAAGSLFDLLGRIFGVA